ncbi:MAG: alpha/beta hydrolase [Pseudomonadota bacterium]
MAHPITDPEVLAFIARVEAATEAGAEADPEAQRRAYNAMAERFRVARPAGVAVEDMTLSGVRVRHYRPATLRHPVRVLYCHGGGFVVGSLESHDDVCAEIAVATGCALTAVDYRLAPEHLHPAAFEDALAVARATLEEAPVVLTGDSAGGTLAAALALALKGEAVRGQVLIYPGLGGRALGLASYRENAEAPLLTTADVDAYRGVYGGEDNPSFYVLTAPDLRGVAPCFASGAAVDPLRDDALEYVRRLTESGIAATCTVEAQLPHMWLRARHTSARAQAAFERICRAIEGFAAQTPLNAG